MSDALWFGRRAGSYCAAFIALAGPGVAAYAAQPATGGPAQPAPDRPAQSATDRPAEPAPFRPPAVPLVTHNPYFSVWSFRDRLTDDWSKHWTGATHAICGLVRVDGTTFRYAGPYPPDAPAMEQRGLVLTPTQTIYTFAGGGVELTLSFLSPLLMDDLDLLGRPATYVTWSVRSTDGAAHHVGLYFDVSGEWCVSTTDQPVIASRVRVGEADVLRLGTQSQPVLAKHGDDLRIDWGYLYLAVPDAAGRHTAIQSDRAARDTFRSHGRLPDDDDLRFPRAARDAWPVLASGYTLGRVDSQPVTRTVVLAYDDEFSIEYFHRKLRPYWRRRGADAADLLRSAIREHADVAQRCAAFDEKLTADLRRVGGDQYATLATLAYRQCLAAHKLAADWDNTPLMFSKENFSNGCIATVDVIYPAAPLFLLLNRELLHAQLRPVLDYARSPRWPHPFAPHDLGTYPHANGQVYGGGERSADDQMPVEETANMLLLLAAAAQFDDSNEFAEAYWPLLVRWAEYLVQNGLDPANQLCTDDFAGHLAHNANLSLKAILALAAFADMNQRAGAVDDAARYRRIARDYAAQWQRMADDGEHYRLAFDRPGTWSQKYNLIWDRVLKLGVFPPEVTRRELRSYLARQNRYGLPLDNRATYAKLDWTVWTATLAESRADFETLVQPLYDFAHETPDRVPLTDWYSTSDARKVGFQARSVVGGVFMPLLGDEFVRARWSARAATTQPRP